MSKPDSIVADCGPSSTNNDNEASPAPIVWTSHDAMFTRLFQAWDNLPPYDPATETTLLRQLDDIIPPFDAYINHSDAGFVAWVSRHQRAMELGLAVTPHWPKLYRLDKAGNTRWKDEEWVKRYSFLVHQRDIIAKSRLAQMTCFPWGERFTFFGRLLARPRQTLRTTGSKPRPARMPARWYYPLDRCLEAMALNSLKLDLVELRRQFWGTDASASGLEPAPQVADAAGEEVKEERFGDSIDSAIWIA